VVDLYAYSKSVEAHERPISIETIHNRSLTEGPLFAKWLDGYKTYLFGRANKREFFTDDIYREYSECEPDFSKVRISNIYRSNFLFMWKAPLDKIQKVSMEPVVQEDGFLVSFREHLRVYLERLPLELISEKGYTELLKSSFKGTYEGKNAEQVFKRPAFIRGKSRIAYVERELKAARTACVEELESLVTIRWIERNVNQIIGLDRRDYMSKSVIKTRSELQKSICSYDRESKKHVSRTSYCRDFNKEGNTKPRNLLRIMLEVLFEKTKFTCFSYVNFYDVWTVVDGDETFQPLRGHGLGMANSLTTLMQFVIEDMAITMSNVKPYRSFYCNDDAALIFDSKDDAHTFASNDRIVCKNLGLSFKEKASFIAEGEVVFCEQFARTQSRGPVYGSKGSHTYMAFYNLLKCANCAHARMIASGVDATNVPKECLSEVIEYWGWVLFRNEHTRSSNQGGWFKRTFEHIDVSYVDKIGHCKLGREEQCAAECYDEVKLEHFPWDKRKFKERLYDYFDPKYLDTLGLTETLEAKDLQRPSFNPVETKRGWDKYLYSLRKAFSRKQRAYDLHEIGRTTYKESYERYIRMNPKKDVIPPMGCRKSKFRGNMVTHWKTSFRKPYDSFGIENDSLIYATMGERNSYNIRVAGEVTELGDIPNELNLSKEAVKSIYERRRTDAIAKEPTSPKNWEAFILPRFEDMAIYHNPFTYLKCCDALGSQYEVWEPEVMPEEKRILLEERSLYYGKTLSVDEWMLIGGLNPVDQVVIAKSSQRWVWDPGELEHMCALMKKYPGIGRTCFGEYTLSNFDRNMEIYSTYLRSRYVPPKEEPDEPDPIPEFINLELGSPLSDFEAEEEVTPIETLTEDNRVRLIPWDEPSEPEFVEEEEDFFRDESIENISIESTVDMEPMPTDFDLDF